MAGEAELKPTAECGAVDRRDEGLLGGLDPAANSPSEASFITFIERPGMSQVMTAMPSTPRATVRFVIAGAITPAR